MKKCEGVTEQEAFEKTEEELKNPNILRRLFNRATNLSSRCLTEIPRIVGGIVQQFNSSGINFVKVEYDEESKRI